MNDPFYNLYRCIINCCQHSNIDFEFFLNLGTNDPANLVDPNNVYNNLSQKFDIMKKRRIIFHDQEPILFDSYKANWEYKVIYLNRLQTNHILSNSEINSEDKNKLLERSGWHDFYWFSNGFLSLEWYRFYEYAKFLENNWQPQKTFSSYNRIFKGREHRLKIAKHIYNNYADKSILSCHADENSIDQNIFLNTVNTANENLSFTIHEDDFINSFCHVVTERIYDESRIHLTEKVFRPIICCRPFILVSSPGSLKYLKRYGFKTFDAFWSEQYDDISDHESRLQEIFKIIDQVGKLSQNEILNLLDQMKSILLFNRQHFYNGFKKTITKELFNNLDIALSQNNYTTPYFKQLINSLNNEEISFLKNLGDMDIMFSTEDDLYENKLLMQILNKTLVQNKDYVVRPDVKKFAKILRYQFLGTKSLD